MQLPVSDEGAPDENPPFDLFATGSFNYPYTLRQNIKNRRPPKELRAVYLENEYLKCTVLPDLGGHVYTCIDKTTGQPMFYANPSIKEQLVSFRGAWSAFGIEFNFPVSHNWVSVSPVDFSYRTHEDGSASVTVGNVDRVYGMEWTVTITLRPGAALLETHSTLVNRDRVRHRFYWWTNAGVQVWGDSKLYYPMQFSAAHGFADIDTWPVNSKGMDLSLIRNHTDGPVSRFVYASREPFMGIYHPHTQTGVVHYADYAKLPGKKIWTWGVDPEGLRWRKLLSDNDSAYAEVQAGLYRNQETFAFLEPQQVIQFSEFWMPVNRIGGITRANLNGVLFMDRETPNSLRLGVNSNRDVSGGSIILLDGDKVLLKQTATVAPERPWMKVVEHIAPDRKYTLVWQDAGGTTLLKHTEGEWDWSPKNEVHVGPQKRYEPPPQSEWTDGDFAEAGKEQEQLGAVLKADRTYDDGLTRYPSSYDLLKASGRLDVGLLRYSDAAKKLGEAEARDTTDAEVHYYRGLALARLSRTYDARLELEAAARTPEWTAAGSLALAELLAREHLLDKAEQTIAQAQAASPNSESIAEAKAVLARLLKNPDQSSIRTNALERFPDSNLLRVENSAADSRSDAIWHHLAADPERVLNVAATYMRLGDYRSALDLLSRRFAPVGAGEAEPGSVLPQDHPMVAYYRAFCKQMLGQSAEADLHLASQLPVRYVFPNRADSEEVLRSALKANDRDAHAHWLLGALLFAHGQVTPALEQWQAARRIEPDIPSLDASLGRELLEQGKADEAAQVLREGTKSDASNPLVYVELDKALIALRRTPAERAEMLSEFPKATPRPSMLTFLLARELAEAGDFKRATALFENQYFENAESGADAREVYLEVKLKEARASARKGDCSRSILLEKSATQPVARIPFTSDNLGEVIDHSKALQGLQREISAACPEAAPEH